jgi:acetoin:2,6-dichlorophenolindophenol oxidoreductase subunit alpha
MLPDLWSLYALMKKSRLFEEAVARLWQDGLISGEMHLGTGEEAIVAGVLDHLQPGDALALDHRGTSPLIMRGVDPVAILREMLGRADGLCRGQGGHMHLFSKNLLAASSGIVGAAGPAAAGFALAAQVLRPKSMVVAFFGEGAVNQGMLMESLNLATVWKLPVLFVCKDDSWSIISPSDQYTAGNLAERARGFDLPYVEVDGRDVISVWEAARPAIERARAGSGPTFLHAHCVHLEAHFLGYQLVRAVRNPLRELPSIVKPLARSFLRRGGTRWRDRLRGIQIVNASLMATLRDPRRRSTNDPLHRIRAKLRQESDQLHALEQALEEEVSIIVSIALQGEFQ